MILPQSEPAHPESQVLSGPLPNGRHFLPRALVEQNQRQRLLAALVVAVSEHGYAGLTIGDVVAGAGVSRRTFYEHFAHKQEAMLAAYDASFARMLEAIEEACVAQSDWPDKVRAAIVAVLRFAATEPAAARLLCVEAFTSGPEGTRRVLESRQQLSVLLVPGRTHSARAAQLPALAEQALVDAIWMTIAACLVKGESERVCELEPQLVELALVQYLGCEAAARLAASPG